MFFWSFIRKNNPFKSFGISPDAIAEIRVSDHSGRSVTLVNAQQHQPFIDHLRTAKARTQTKVRAELELEIKTKAGEVVRLRMNRRCLGPDVPASTMTKRWCFNDEKLFEYFTEQLKNAI